MGMEGFSSTGFLGTRNWDVSHEAGHVGIITTLVKVVLRDVRHVTLVGHEDSRNLGYWAVSKCFICCEFTPFYVKFLIFFGIFCTFVVV